MVFIGANDGEKSYVARHLSASQAVPTYNAIMMVISQVETSFIHRVSPVAAACVGTRAQGSPCRFPLNPSEPPPKVARRSYEIILQTCFGQAAVAGVAKTITADQLTLSALDAIAMVHIQLKRLGQHLPATGLQQGVIFADDQRTVGLRGGDALRPSWTYATKGAVPFESIIPLPVFFLAQPTTVTTGLPGRTDRLSLLDFYIKGLHGEHLATIG